MSKVRISQKRKDVMMRNLCDTIFYMKTDVWQDFHICSSVPLINLHVQTLKFFRVYFF